MKRKNKLLAILLVLSLLIAAAPAASLAASPVLDNAEVYYTPSSDYQSGDCILSASKMMIRRASILRGSNAWASITNKTLRTPATIFGLLLNSFTFEADGLAYKVGCGFFSGAGNDGRIKEFEALVRAHPEGVVVWGEGAATSGTHGVLLVDVRNGVPYAADSSRNTGSQKKGIQKWSDTTMKDPVKVTKYWYIKEVGISKNTTRSNVSQSAVSTLSIKSQTVPGNLKQGKTFAVKGTVNSNYRLSNVTVAVVGSDGATVIGKSVNPNATSYKLSKIDKYLKFGTLAPGSYRYVVSATDQLISATLVDSPFMVTGKASAAPTDSTLRITSVKAPSSIKKGKSFSIKGKVKSNVKITKVSIQVTDAAGNVKLKASAKPKAKSYNLKRLDSKLRFRKLKRGTYYYRVYATDKAKSLTLVDQGFVVR
jgi:hypothetical protein